MSSIYSCFCNCECFTMQKIMFSALCNAESNDYLSHVFTDVELKIKKTAPIPTATYTQVIITLQPTKKN